MVQDVICHQRIREERGEKEKKEGNIPDIEIVCSLLALCDKKKTLCELFFPLGRPGSPQVYLTDYYYCSVQLDLVVCSDKGLAASVWQCKKRRGRWVEDDVQWPGRANQQADRSVGKKRPAGIQTSSKASQKANIVFSFSFFNLFSLRYIPVEVLRVC